MWWNKSDCLVSVHSLRDDTGRYTGEVIVKTLKMKNQKLNGRPGEVMLGFNIKTNRYGTFESEVNSNLRPIKKIIEDKPDWV